MNIFEQYKKYKDRKFRERVLPIFDEYFKGKTNTDIVQWQKDKRQDLQAMEYRMWFEGKQEKLEWFYKRYMIQAADQYTMEFRNNLFWRVVNNESVKLHFPLASMISEAMANLLFNKKPTFTVEVENNEEVGEGLTELLNDIFEDSKIDELLLRGAELESYSGTLAFRPIIDTRFSKYPILKFHPVSEFELVQKYGKVLEIVFAETYTHKNKKYVLKIHHGYGYIRYKLYQRDKEVPINTIPDTDGLRDVYLTDSKGQPVRVLLAAYKVNRPVDNEFVDGLYGESDYASLLDTFQAIDETYSAIIDRIRKGHILTAVSEDLTTTDPTTGKAKKISDYEMKTVLLNASPDPTLRSYFERNVPNIDIQPLYDSLQQMLRNGCSRVGLSPNTVMENLGGANSSAEALAIREGVSERTREAKARLWEQFLEAVARISLICYDVQFADVREKSGANEFKIINDYEECIFKCVFPPYQPEDWRDRLPSLKEALEAGLIDRENALKQLWKDDYTDKEIENIKNEIEGIIPLDIKETEV